MSKQKAPSTARLISNYIDNPSKGRKLRKSQVSLKIVPSYLQKETWDREYLALKSFNNTLANQNQKLKIQNRHLQSQLQKFHKNNQINPSRIQKESVSLKGMVTSMKRQLEQLNRQNQKMKRSIKFTTVSQIQLYIQQILLESQRILSLLVHERKLNADLKLQQSKYAQKNKKLHRINAKMNLQQNKLNQIIDQLPRRPKNLTPSTKREPKRIKQEKVKVKQQQIQTQQSPQQTTKLKVQNIIKQVPKVQCLSCKQLQHRSEGLANQINAIKLQKQKLASQTQKLKSQRQKLQLQIQIKSIQSNSLIQNSVRKPTTEQTNKLRRFLIYRFQWLQIPPQKIIAILKERLKINSAQVITIGDLLEIIVSQPFSLVSDRYIQIFVASLCQGKIKIANNSELVIEESRKVNKEMLVSRFIRFIGKYTIGIQDLFMKSAEIITDNKRELCIALNGQKTISQQKFNGLLKQLGVQQQCINYMISQVVAESFDLDHLNLQELFKILCLPQLQQNKQKEKPQGNEEAIMQSQIRKKPEQCNSQIQIVQEQYLKQDIQFQLPEFQNPLVSIQFQLPQLQNPLVSKIEPTKRNNNFFISNQQ